MEKKKKTDLRVVRTKKHIRNALLELLAQKELYDITVTEVAARAEINRKTFYTYYPNVAAVIDEMADGFTNAFVEDVRSLGEKGGFRNPAVFFDRMQELVDNNMETCSVLFKYSGKTDFVKKVSLAVKKEVVDYYSDNEYIDTSTVGLIADFVIGGLFGAYSGWFNFDRKVPISFVAYNTGHLIMEGINGFLPDSEGDN